jgi:hypothetical protein
MHATGPPAAPRGLPSRSLRPCPRLMASSLCHFRARGIDEQRRGGSARHVVRDRRRATRGFSETSGTRAASQAQAAAPRNVAVE